MGRVEKAPCCRAADGTLLWAPRQMWSPVDKLVMFFSVQGAASATKALPGISVGLWIMHPVENTQLVGQPQRGRQSK